MFEFQFNNKQEKIDFYMFCPLLLSWTDSSRVYTPPDPPGYFDGHVWPMYLKNRREMEIVESGIGECPVRGATCKECDADVIKPIYVAETSKTLINNATVADVNNEIKYMYMFSFRISGRTGAKGRAAGCSV